MFLLLQRKEEGVKEEADDVVAEEAKNRGDGAGNDALPGPSPCSLLLDNKESLYTPTVQS